MAEEGVRHVFWREILNPAFVAENQGVHDLINAIRNYNVEEEVDPLPRGGKPTFNRLSYGFTRHDNHLHVIRTVPYTKYKKVKRELKQLRRELKDIHAKVEAMWDAPGMPGCNALLDELEDMNKRQKSE